MKTQEKDIFHFIENVSLLLICSYVFTVIDENINLFVVILLKSLFTVIVPLNIKNKNKTIFAVIKDLGIRNNYITYNYPHTL